MNSKELLKIANEFGTPVYVYDAESIKTQYEKLTSSFLKHTKFFYAAKALDQYQYPEVCEKSGCFFRLCIYQ
jgi:diaminopimelate decarboxylase